MTRWGRIAAVCGHTWMALLAYGPVSAQPNLLATPDPVMRVGPDRAIKTIANAAGLARAGATIQVDAGVYPADVAVWLQNGITIRAVGGRVRLVAQGAAAEGKAIWVVRAKGMHVEGFDFIGARVADKNGAGIRLEHGTLVVRDCAFIDNQNGLLTSNDPTVELDVINSEFGYNGYGDGQSHNLYVGAIARLSVTDSYSHHARVGHLLKSRAAASRIVNNRLIDGDDGTASYELEFPNGGVAYVVGNTIAQSTRTENPYLIAFGAEGYKWPHNSLYLANNTLINPLPHGFYLKVAPGADAIQMVDNVLLGYGSP